MRWPKTGRAAPPTLHPRLRRVRSQTPKETAMKWETPAAQDLRFGFEITMYIAAR